MTAFDNRLGRPRSRFAGLRRIEAAFLRPRRAVLLSALIGLLAQAALCLPIPVLQGNIVDQVTARLQRSGAHGEVIRSAALSVASLGPPAAIGLCLLAMVACHLARLALGWKISARMSRITLEVVRELTDTLHQKLQRLEMSYFDREPTGHIMAKLTSDVGSLLIFLSGGSLQLVSDLVLAAGISGFLFWLEWRLALVGMLAMPLFVVNHRYFSGAVHDLSRAVREQVSALYALLSEKIPSVRVVRSFVAEEAELAEFDRRLNLQKGLTWDCMRTVARQGAWSSLINGLGIVGVLASGTLLVKEGKMSVGDLVACAALLSQLYQPIVRLTGAQAMVAATVVAVDRIVEVLDEPEAPTGRPRSCRSLRQAGRLVYRDVSFRYPRGARNVLDRINLEIDCGMTVGILGPSGSGKSTLLALAPRIYPLPDERGAILLGGQDVRDLDLRELRRTLGLVPQAAMLFEGTIRSNLTYAAPDADRRVVDHILEVTCLAHWVGSLPLGLDSPVGERGQTLSGGQRQRIALARALIADPAILLLDDCTSALDSETESQIGASLSEYWADRTRIIVSHKVASVRDADRIIVLDSGAIVEDGTHSTLMRRGGYYADTYLQQTSAYHARRSIAAT
jgi:ABC-type multidrug transport system fused ATPase/permease subunit